MEKDIGIVLRVVPFGETSCVTTIFTRGLGKISALAKGARRPKSPFESALDLLAISRIVLIHKSHDALDLLTEAKLERRFRSGARDLACLYAGYYVVELLRDLTSDADPHAELYDAADATLWALDHNVDAGRAVVRFELAGLRLLGHLPSLETCAECGGRVPEGKRVAFGHISGGVLCEECRVGKRQVVSISRDVLRLLQEFADPAAEDWQQRPVPPAVWGEARGVLNYAMRHVLGHPPRMLAYLGMPGGRTATPRKPAR